jgi:hypothetical protein
VQDAAAGKAKKTVSATSAPTEAFVCRIPWSRICPPDLNPTSPRVLSQQVAPEPTFTNDSSWPTDAHQPQKSIVTPLAVWQAAVKRP